jgi:hypothetical protein
MCHFKSFGSEVLDFVVDEGVQIHGGMGYSAEKNIERAYRDSRINRIFEGTNEINRMLTVSMILRKASKGEIDLLGPAKEISNELLSIPEINSSNGSAVHNEITIIKNFKKALLLVAGATVQKFGNKLTEQQEVLMNIADIINHIYLCESTLLRVQKAGSFNNYKNYTTQLNMLKVLVYDSCDKINKHGKDIINAISEGDESLMIKLGLKRFTKHSGLNTVKLRREIAKKVIEENQYCF